MKVEFIEKIKESNNTYSFIFKTNEKAEWEPGQYIYCKIPHKNPDNRGVIRHFTISSAPYEGEIRITTKFDFENGSSFKKALFALERGTIVKVFDIGGEFVINDPDKRYVFIVGGIGITPCRSIFLDLVHKGVSPDVTLLYGNRNDDIAFKDIMDKLAEGNDWLDANYIMEPQQINEEVIKQNVDELDKSIWYLSGPPKMVKAIEEILLDMGISKSKMVIDYFHGYDD